MSYLPRAVCLGILGLLTTGLSWAEQSQEIKLPPGVGYALKELERPENHYSGVNQLLRGSSAAGAAGTLNRQIESVGITGTNEAEALYLSRLAGIFGTIRVGVLGELRQDANVSASKGAPAAQCRLRHEVKHRELRQLGNKAAIKTYDEHIADSFRRLQETEDLMQAACEARHLIVFGINRESRRIKGSLADAATASPLDMLPIHIAYLVLLELARTGYWAAQEDLCQMLPWHKGLEEALAKNEEPTSVFCASAASQGSAWAQFAMVTKHMGKEPLRIPAPSELSGTPEPRLRLLKNAVARSYVPAMEYYILEASRQKTGDPDVVREATWAGSPLGAQIMGDTEYQLMSDASEREWGESRRQQYRKQAVEYYRNAAAWGSARAQEQLHKMGELTSKERLDKALQAPQVLQAELAEQCTEKHAEPKMIFAKAVDRQNDTFERALRFSMHQFHCGRLIDELYPGYSNWKRQDRASAWPKDSLQWCANLGEMEIARWQWEELLRKEGCY